VLPRIQEVSSDGQMRYIHQQVSMEGGGAMDLKRPSSLEKSLQKRLVSFRKQRCETAKNSYQRAAIRVLPSDIERAALVNN